ncbi:Sodium/hydrogen exchanger family-domain-containing protein [Cokeromyces recurvatus]|uniref:Sodium/hydrogen exchanger family-domain-containing protein n=1 Tax=Cokeromyces recurvatus TaxID=90255 RepID=UPI00221F586B|nr:Sodium/hydrogen exchanger family-domain-containing protein [Cokeromyces recurvatus]KAI7898807.1 Sodium/hydrogen exchanger family-domain-containing protein [Cokeromyces recurvatus]
MDPNVNNTLPENGPIDQPLEEEMYSSWALLILTILLIGALWTSYYLQLKKIRAIHETVISIMAGMIVGLIIKLSPGTIIQDMVKFKQGFFFNLLLPPIILNSGYELKRRNFFLNFGTILIFAMAGTFIAAIVTGLFTFLYAFLNPEGISISFLDSMIFGSILSATDPVTILAIFNQLHVDPQLYSIISGESLLNDAVAIVLSDTLRKFRGQELHAVNIFRGIGLFLGVFWASTFIGVLVGILVALMLKYSQLYRFPSIESCLVLLFAYSSYFFSNSIQMSGIVTLLFTGIILKHYAYDNLSLRSKRATKFIFQLLSQLSENFIFIYLGINLFTQDNLDYKPLFILFTLAFICIARYTSVSPLSMMINAVCRALGKPEQLPRNHQIMLFWAGLRGAVAFALAAGITGDSAPAMRTTILAVVVLTVLLFGGTTGRMLQILDIKTGVIEPDESDDSQIEEDEGDYLPLTRKKKYMKLNTNNLSQENLLNNSDDNNNNNDDDDDDDELLEIGQLSQQRRKRFRDYENDVSIGGLLSGPLGEPIPEDRPPHWFVSFDEKWLKPFLTKKNVQQRNQTLAEYWREKRRKMERANKSMLDGIRNMNIDQDNDDALTLNSVHTSKGTLSNQHFSNISNRETPLRSFPRRSSFGQGASSSKLVVGSGRVFGRSPSDESEDDYNHSHIN